MKSMYRIVALCLIVFSSFVLIRKDDPKPTLFMIGDSTVKNGRGNGGGGLWGWGDFIAPFFDTTKIRVRNHALGGTSTRTFQSMGLWTKVLDSLKAGDFVIMQFGHNDSSPLDDTARARGTIKGVGEESKEIFNPKTQKQEVVYTYGYYLRKFIADIKAKGATAIVCSPIPRYSFKDGKVPRAGDSYGGWAKQTAEQSGSFFIDLNEKIASQYELSGPEKVKTYFPTDNTHTNLEGAQINAALVVEGIAGLEKCGLKKFLSKK